MKLPQPSCQTCGEELHHPDPTCVNCHEIETRLPAYLRSAGGKLFVWQKLTEAILPTRKPISNPHAKERS